jgi:NAD+ diphosphatase
MVLYARSAKLEKYFWYYGISPFATYGADVIRFRLVATNNSGVKIMLSRFQRAYPPAQPQPGPVYWFPFRKDELIVQVQETGIAFLRGGEALQSLLHPHSTLYIGTLDGIACIACELPHEFVLPTGWRSLTLRSLLGMLDDATYAAVSYAEQILLWQHSSRYCPVCTHATRSMVGTWGRQCANCGYTSYPPVSPAILVLVHDGEDHVLLTHKPGWGKRYSCIAGFVEPCESLEECVQREVYEEVGVEVTDISYVGSQPWPFPHQLMVGYTARYSVGIVKIDKQELDDAVWYHIDALPELPSLQSLAYRIIMRWVSARHSPTPEPRG